MLIPTSTYLRKGHKHNKMFENYVKHSELGFFLKKGKGL